MFKKIFTLAFFISSMYSLDLGDEQQQEACLHLFRTAEIIGCHRTAKMAVKTQTVLVCDQFYLTNENDTCEIIAENLSLPISVLKNVVDCESIEANKLVCFSSDNGANGTHETFIEPYAESDLDLIVSGETTKDVLESVNTESEHSDSDFEVEIAEGLRQHNFYRKLHKVNELVYNETIGAEAQKWAEHLASTKELEHNYQSPYGENIAQACGYPGFTVSIAASKWYEEIKNFNFTTGLRISKDLDIGHFTQLVWKSTKEVGFGKAIDDQGCIYVVANYFPPGNIRGRFTKDVLDLE